MAAFGLIFEKFGSQPHSFKHNC